MKMYLVNNRTKVKNIDGFLPVHDLTKIAINSKRYAICGYGCGELMAVKVGDAINDGFAPLYVVWNSVKDNTNVFNAQKFGIVEVK